MGKRISFFHGTRSENAAEILRQFSGGAKANGIGQGGQDNGFYIYTDLASARRHADQMLGKSGIPGNLFVVQVESDFDPKQWDLDYELHDVAALRLIGDHRALLARTAGELFTYSSEGVPHKFSLQTIHDKGFTLHHGSKKMGFAFARQPGAPMIGHAGILQCLMSNLAKVDPAFAAAKEALIADFAGEPEKALKYIGAEPLRVKSIEVLNRDGWKALTLLPSNAAAHVLAANVKS
jgi:hypothetical protein